MHVGRKMDSGSHYVARKFVDKILTIVASDSW